MIRAHKVDVVAIGNGTASKESEIFIADLLKEIDRDVKYAVISEAGASVYSASKLAAEEFPEFDVMQRSAVSIARRMQDPLAELVKIEPRSIGVGQYQHDMKPARLDGALGGVVEDCVNSVGVDVNTASYSLLSYISGISATAAKNIVKYREENGAFKKRPLLGIFTAAAVAPLANTGIFLAGMLTVFRGVMLDFADGIGMGGVGALYFAIVVLVGINFIIEFGANLLLSPAISSIVKAVKKIGK